MPKAVSKAERKQKYFAKLIKLLDEYSKILLVTCDNVGSNHMQKIRQSVRGEAVILMGKNTLIRRAMRQVVKRNDKISALLPYIVGNVGFVFTKGDLSAIRKTLMDQKVGAPAKAGAIAPCTVSIPAGPTGMEPTKTSFLQALNIPSKITRGQIEIISAQVLITEGEKVGSSEATLLQMLNIKPFEYMLKVTSVYDAGSIYSAKVLDLTDDDILAKFHSGVSNIAAIGLTIGYPTVASLPHSIIRAYKKVLSITLATNYTFPRAELIKQMIENPGAFAAKSAAPAAAAKTEEAEKPAAKQEEEEEESDEGLGGGMFGDDDDDDW